MESHSFGEKFRAFLATGRVANLPTVWSNVIVAFYFAAGLNFFNTDIPDSYRDHFDLWILLFACVAASCLYVGGCMLGDYRDIRFDREHRPGRPLVTGLLKPSVVCMVAIGLLLLGLIIGGLSNAAALLIAFDVPLKLLSIASKTDVMTMLQVTNMALLGLLVLFIVIYALFHKKSRPFALANMALCRTQLIIFSAALAMPVLHHSAKLSFHYMWLCSPVMIMACSVGIYTLLLASVAATESNKDKIKFSIALKCSMFLLPILAVAALSIKDSEHFPLFNHLALSTETYSTNTVRGYFIGTVVVYCGWMIYAFGALPADKPAFVSRALAGFCLLDACFAATYSLTIPLVCIILFGLALLLQKIAPAT